MVFHSAGGQTRLNKVKASGGCHRFSEEIYRAELDKNLGANTPRRI
ncbi:hypothetical protein [Siminovitchia terrae]|nr:hypothetical protein [Siminovitchia terrae]